MAFSSHGCILSQSYHLTMTVEQLFVINIKDKSTYKICKEIGYVSCIFDWCLHIWTSYHIHDIYVSSFKLVVWQKAEERHYFHFWLWICVFGSTLSWSNWIKYDNGLTWSKQGVNHLPVDISNELCRHEQPPGFLSVYYCLNASLSYIIIYEQQIIGTLLARSQVNFCWHL